ncbi:NUDIX hydrolase [Carnobacterium funditum]|uniref:NUDIX hydrolase n=1 Tax=Carnobacterium funditum TaxID=2752 RepID=UPI0009FCD1D0|nr:NUDIX domain-containing protein [Carnobacterium funditum]
MIAHTFGKRLKTEHYHIRIGVYGILLNRITDKIIVVSPPNGSYLLPGGEKEKQETDEETLKRESVEELGFQIEVGKYVGAGEDYFYSTHREKYYHNPAYFYVIDSWEKISEPLEDFNGIEWMTLPEALKKLKRGSHRWAIEQFIKDKKEKNDLLELRNEEEKCKEKESRI